MVDRVATRNVDPLAHVGLVKRLAARYRSDLVPYEDRLAAGYVGLLRGCDSYVPDPRYKAATWLKMPIRTEIRGVCAIEANRAKRFFTAPSRQFDFPDRREVSRLDAREEIGVILSDLKPRDRLIIELRYGLDGNGERSFDEIGEMLGVSYNAIFLVHKRVIKYLKYRWGHLK